MSLNTQVPQVDIHLLEMTIEVFRVIDIEPERRERSILGGVANSNHCRQRGHRILSGRRKARHTREGRPGVGQIDIGLLDRVAKRRAKRHLVGVEHVRPVTRHAVRRPDCHLAVARGIKGQSDTREEVHPLVTAEAFPANVMGIARENHARRSVGEDRAMVILSEQLGIDVMNLALLVIDGEVRFPSHAVVHRETPVHFPGILRIERDIILARVKSVASALAERSCVTSQQVRQPQAGRRAIEGH